jgi:hypothetical protein
VLEGTPVEGSLFVHVRRIYIYIYIYYKGPSSKGARPEETRPETARMRRRRAFRVPMHDSDRPRCAAHVRARTGRCAYGGDGSPPAAGQTGSLTRAGMWAANVRGSTIRAARLGRPDSDVSTGMGRIERVPCTPASDGRCGAVARPPIPETVMMPSGGYVSARVGSR